MKNKLLKKYSVFLLMLGTIGILTLTGCGDKTKQLEKENLPTATSRLTTVSEKLWNGLNHIKAEDVWSDGENTYSSDFFGNYYVLNETTWEKKEWNFPISKNETTFLSSKDIWTDGENIYYSYLNDSSEKYIHYMLKDGNWESIKWKGFTDFSGEYIWTDGTNAYCFDGENHYMLKNNTWEQIKWNDIELFYPEYIWTDGVNTYYSQYQTLPYVTNYILKDNKWVEIKLNDIELFDPGNVWSDGTNCYYSNIDQHFILKNNKWVEKTWNGFTEFTGRDVWKDNNIIHIFL